MGPGSGSSGWGGAGGGAGSGRGGGGGSSSFPAMGERRRAGGCGALGARAENVRCQASRGGNAAGAVAAGDCCAGAEGFPPSQRRAERRWEARAGPRRIRGAETARYPRRGSSRMRGGGPSAVFLERPPAARAARALRLSSRVKAKSAMRVGRAGAERGAACSRRAGAAQHLAGCSCCQLCDGVFY